MRLSLPPRRAGSAGQGRSALRDAPGVHSFLAFGLGSEQFALPLGSVREILKLCPITEVPRSKPYVLGILSVRGRITTVIDLRHRLRMPPTESTKNTRILLVDGGGEVIGLLVDRVFQVHRLFEDEMEWATEFSGEVSECVTGIGRPGLRKEARDRSEGDFLLVLNPKALVGPSR